jgi:hypothetical protein
VREVTTEASTNAAKISSREIRVVSAAWSLRRRAVWRYTKIDAISVAMRGNRKVEKTRAPGLVSGLRDENTNSIIVMAPPAPITAASSEQRITSLSRIR